MTNDSFFGENKSARIAVSLALCIPLVLAVVFAFRINPNSVAPSAVKSIAVSVNGQSTTFSDDSSFAAYSDITKNALEIDSTFREFADETPYEVTFTENDGKTLTYKLYMVNDAADCVFSDAEGKYFMMDPEVAKLLLTRGEFSDVNQDSFLPVASIERNGITISLSPSVFTWNYKDIDGKDKVSNGDRTVSNPVVKFDSENIGVLSFDREPDSIKVTITNGSDLLFDDVFENLGAAFSTYTSDTKFDMTIKAEWFQLEDSEYYGTLTYKLSALYDVNPTFTIVDDHSLPKGDFTIVRMSDFNDGEDLIMQNDMGIPQNLKVYDKADEPGVKFAFIPLMASLSAGTHTVTFSTVDGYTQSFDIGVREPNTPYSTQTIIVTNEALQSAFTSAGFEEWTSTVASAISTSENAQLWTDKFVYPTGSSEVVSGGARFGTTRDVKSLYSNTYIHEAMDLAASSGQSVYASNSGKVVYAGNLTLYGGTVIIDHGSGVFSYYGNLASTNVQVGDSVTNQTVIGTAGSTGFACNSNGTNVTMVHFGISVGGIFIDPSSPCKYGINF